jgi:hypothetical protein
MSRRLCPTVRITYVAVVHAYNLLGEGCVQTVSTIGRFITDTACAVLYALSIAISFGIAAAAYSHRLLPTLVAALAGLIIAGGGFGYVIKRTYWPRRKRRMLKPMMAS